MLLFSLVKHPSEIVTKVKRVYYYLLAIINQSPGRAGGGAVCGLRGAARWAERVPGARARAAQPARRQRQSVRASRRATPAVARP